MPSLTDRIKWMLFPGFNLHARQRNRDLPKRLLRPDGGQPRRVLDAGCGNGMLSYQSYLLGNSVLGLTFKEGEVVRNRRRFHDLLGADRSRLEFRSHNLYRLDEIADDGPFDQIICTEVLEHIKGDDQIVAAFAKLLKPGGRLLVTTPNAEHPYHASFPLDPEETGGHVRPGYTEQTYRELFEPAGLVVESVAGMGGRLRQAVNNRIIRGEESFGVPVAAAVFAVGAPLMLLDRGEQPDVPFSLVAEVTKPADRPLQVDAPIAETATV